MKIMDLEEKEAEIIHKLYNDHFHPQPANSAPMVSDVHEDKSSEIHSPDKMESR
jgi:hypothetical protein